MRDGAWYPGELRSRDQAEDGSWSAMIELGAAVPVWTVFPTIADVKTVPAPAQANSDDRTREAVDAVLGAPADSLRTAEA